MGWLTARCELVLCCVGVQDSWSGANHPATLCQRISVFVGRVILYGVPNFLRRQVSVYGPRDVQVFRAGWLAGFGVFAYIILYHCLFYVCMCTHLDLMVLVVFHWEPIIVGFVRLFLDWLAVHWLTIRCQLVSAVSWVGVYVRRSGANHPRDSSMGASLFVIRGVSHGVRIYLRPTQRRPEMCKFFMLGDQRGPVSLHL